MDDQSLHDHKLRPFDMSYVIKTTVKHMRKDIDISIRKTFDRISEFAGDREKSEEIFRTLAHLHSMRKQMDVMQGDACTQSDGE